MWTSGRRVLQDMLSLSAVRSFSVSPVQNTVVVERWWKVPLSKEGSPPRLHPRRHRIYKLVEDTQHRPKEKMELILTQTVAKLGGRGDTVFVAKSLGRNKLLPQGLAVYASPENKQMFAEELRLLREGRPEDRIQTRTGQLTVEFLKQFKMTMPQMPSDEFQVNKEVLCRWFFKKGLVVPPHTLSFPFESVKDLGDYWCEVTVNGMDTVRIPVTIVPYQDMSARYQKELRAQRQLQAAAEMSGPADEEEATLKAVSDSEVGAKIDEESVSEVSESSTSAGASAAEETAASTSEQKSEDTTAPPSDSLKKD